MDFEQYLQTVRTRFSQSHYAPSLKADVFYEEVFEMKWLATKLKQFSFVSSAEHITADLIKAYSTDCVNFAIKEYKGLPRGFQNGVVSYSVLASYHVDAAAIDFAMARPQKHFSAFELPIIIDLANKKIYFYQGKPIWGSLYYKFFRDYIVHNFAL